MEETPDYARQDEMKSKQAVAHSERPVFDYTLLPILTLIIGIAIGFVGSELLNAQNRIDNETLIQQAVTALQTGQEERIANSILTALTQGQAPAPQPLVVNETVSIDDDPSIGSENAPVVVIEFSDFQCGYCKRFHDQTLTPLLETYGDKILFVYRDFAILGQTSVDAALAAECADDQDRFWEYHDQLFANQNLLGRSAFLQFASELGLDMDVFTRCIEEQTYLQEVLADGAYAQRLGANGTPAFFINNRFVSGAQPFDIFANIIDEELAKKSN